MSHCLVTAHVVAEGYSFSWDYRPYFRKAYYEQLGIPFKSKNDLAIEMVQSFPANEEEQVYVLMDSWYTSRKLVNFCNAKGFHVIGAVKSNPKINPIGIQGTMAEFANRYIQNDDLPSVTVKDKGKFRGVSCVRIQLWMSCPSSSTTISAGKSKPDTAISRNS
ncbi:transposase [Bacillus sp. V5-8f]|uniref:transposase n=1 Tax=Bacillus sp. V5-8f TaxID=2053044 RepID=UPI0015E115EB|nr:transposase [Bacillus sp. V5-8f]